MLLLFSCQVVSDSLELHGLQHARTSCPSPSPGVCPSSCLLNRWCHPTISSSVPLSYCLQSFPAPGSFPVSQFFASGGQSIGVSVSVSILPVNCQGWFPLGLTGLISLLSKGLSRFFLSTIVWKHQFFVVLVVYWPWIQQSCWIHLFTLKNRFLDKIQNAETIKYWQGDGATEKLVHCLWILLSLHMHVYSSFLQLCPNLKAGKMDSDGFVDYQTVVHPYIGILFSDTKLWRGVEQV